MRITVFGAGYVGLVTAVGFAELGNDVVCVDIDAVRIKKLQQGKSPLFEPGLAQRLTRSLKEERLTFTTDGLDAVADADILFVCVGTPPRSDGSVETKHIETVAKTIAGGIRNGHVVVIKSTVPVGTGREFREAIAKSAGKASFSVVSNPEFLREGAAVNDFFNPDRIVVGLETPESPARPIMEKLYRGIARANRPLMFTSLESAELIKYASNAMLATRISFMNELSAYCEAVGADITEVSKGMGLDTRIGPRFLQAGLGYGGSCFPKDVKGLVAAMKRNRANTPLLSAVERVNAQQLERFCALVRKRLGTLQGKRIALWGLSFKPKTDDVREAPSLRIIQYLHDAGATVSAFDPEAMPNTKELFPDVLFGTAPYDVLRDADALILVTEWDEFRNPDWEKIGKLMKNCLVFDGRNIYRSYADDLVRLGFTYVPVGASTQ